MIRKLLPLFFASLLVLTACNSSGSTSEERSAESSSSEVTSSLSTMTPSSTAAWDGKFLTGKHTVTLKTSKGDITLELDADAAPKAATNFIVLAKSGFYNDLTFHRVIPGFMIQGGDPSGNGTGGGSIYGETFEDEIQADAALYKTGYKKGVVAMANRGPDTNGSQFFIMEADYPLQPDYTIFGHVKSGQNIVTAIANVDRSQDGRDMPVTPVTFSVAVK